MAEQPSGITEISVAGFKSIEKGSIEIRPLTILAGANSSGKSSIMQPMLLMKQTLDATYDPSGPLLLFGPHVQFTEYEQFLPETNKGSEREFSIGFKYGQKTKLVCNFKFIAETEGQARKLDLYSMDIKSSKGNFIVKPGVRQKTINKLVPDVFRNLVSDLNKDSEHRPNLVWGIESSRCFYKACIFTKKSKKRISFPVLSLGPVPRIQELIENLIHLPGLRGNPERTYRIASAQGPSFQGPFQHYISSLISRWQDEDEDGCLDWVEGSLHILNLTSQIRAKTIDDVNVGLHVGRLQDVDRSGSKEDTVSIADVGFGVSQVLPVLVALAVAEPGQMVYIEQPELHLHPNAQVALAEVLANAAMRGVRVVIETHSAVLLQGIMTLIAEEKLESEQVMLHWFQRDEEGKTEITSVEPDENGAYGDWPEDFMEAEMAIQGRYLDAVAERELAV